MLTDDRPNPLATGRKRLTLEELRHNTILLFEWRICRDGCDVLADQQQVGVNVSLYIKSFAVIPDGTNPFAQRAMDDLRVPSVPVLSGHPQ
eukprot:COSAG03_NODE_2938_length_2341_cov_3.695361_2_plen_91_part_00